MGQSPASYRRPHCLRDAYLRTFSVKGTSDHYYNPKRRLEQIDPFTAMDGMQKGLSGTGVEGNSCSRSNLAGGCVWLRLGVSVGMRRVGWS